MTVFGITEQGDEVHAITLSDHGLTATLLTYGVILQSVRLEGVPFDLTVGSPSLSDYEGAMSYHGSIIGPVANRLRKASAPINGTRFGFDPNLNGTHTLHGGSAGTHLRMWKIDKLTSKIAILSHIMPDGEGGFPGNRTITARYEVSEGPTLRLTITTKTDAPSIANATNHSYWNLDGTGHMRDHEVRIAAAEYLPTDHETLPTGDVKPVENTPFDFRQDHQLVSASPELDTTFCVSNGRRSLTDALWLTGGSGITLTVATTEPAIHLYDGRPAYNGLAIEAQGWPDAPNNPNFPSVEITPQSPAVQTTEWRFSR